MALPKYKHAKSNTRTRRAVWLNALKTPEVNTCPFCSRPKQTHRACAYCGTYKNLKVAALKRTRE